MSLTTNKDVYTTVEFDQWAAREVLEPEEAFLIDHYLQKDLGTIEAGTGGGRIILALAARGFSNLHGFDFVPELIEAARQRDSKHGVDFRVGDATELEYADESFDQVLYLQQIICLLDGPEARRQGLREAFRILRRGGTALFSFLGYETRASQPAYAGLIAYLSVLRTLTGSRRPRQELPWLKLGGRFAARSLLDRGPYVYWYRAEEAGRALEETGFQVVAAGTGHQIAKGSMLPSFAALAREPKTGFTFAVCRKQ